jgi:uncharacterized membrane protein YgcG
MRPVTRLFVVSLLMWAVVPRVLLAQRELSWDELAVTARLDADGVLDVAERHAMVFTGDWNGGERVFNVRPRQKLDFLGMERLDATGTPQALRETSVVPNNVDEFVLTNARTLRWRSRLPSDPPFAKTRLTYVLRYRLSGILLKDAEQYRLDHDFAFPDRAGPIARFSLDLALDPVWQPLSDVRERYTAGPLAPGRSFVLTIPLRYTGTGSPAALDTRRPPEVVGAVAAILGVFALGVVAFFVREQSLGRFAPVSAAGIDSRWIEQEILAHPAEVIGAAWDDKVGAPEVVALIARMTGEGKLESQASGTSMTLRLKVDRETLDGHERALVDGLFFGGRTETSTAAVQQHYKNKGFDPAQAISGDLNKRVHDVVPPGEQRVWWLPTVVLLLAGAGLLGWTAYSYPDLRAGPFVMVFVLVFGSILLQIPGWLFRARMDRGMVAAALSMIPAFLVSAGAAAFFWIIVGSGQVELPWTMIAGIAAWVMCLSNASINGLKSRQTAGAIAFRKRLTAGRRFFETELAKPNPALRDNWYPWLLAFGLEKQVDSWSTRDESAATRSSTWDRGTSSSSGSSSSSSSSSNDNSAWTGGGGRSGGAGGGATWAAAAAGMAAGVSAPSSSSSSGGGGSSGGGSSGGGGGGGW